MTHMPTNKPLQNTERLSQVFRNLSSSARLEFLQMFMRSHTSDEYLYVIESLGELYWKTIPRA